MQSFSSLVSRVVPVPSENIDTDRIVPARFLTGTDREGLGRALFADWRLGPDGAEAGRRRPRGRRRRRAA